MCSLLTHTSHFSLSWDHIVHKVAGQLPEVAQTPAYRWNMRIHLVIQDSN